MYWVSKIEWITRFSGALAAALVLPLIGALIIEVVSRHAFGSPTAWAYEVSYMVMGAIFMLGMAEALRVRQHVSVDIISGALSARTNAVIQVLGYLLLLPILAWLVWELSSYAYTAFQTKESSGRSAWSPVVWPLFSIWCLGFFMLTLQVFAELIKAIRVIAGNMGRSDKA